MNKEEINKMFEEAYQEFEKFVPKPDFGDENFDVKAWFEKRKEGKIKFYNFIKKRTIEIIVTETAKQAEIKIKEMLNVNL
jgi:hypothetical protein